MKPARSAETHGLLLSGNISVEKSQRQQEEGREEKSYGAPVTPEPLPLNKDTHSYTSAGLESNFGILLGVTTTSPAYQSPRPRAEAGAVALCRGCCVLTAVCHANLACFAPGLHHVAEISWVSLKSTAPSQQTLGVNKTAPSELFCGGKMCWRFMKRKEISINNMCYQNLRKWLKPLARKDNMTLCIKSKGPHGPHAGWSWGKRIL